MLEDTELIAHFESDGVNISAPLTAMAIDLYPNPAVESFYVKGLEEEAQITIIDSGGQMMMHPQQIAPNQYVDISALPAGMYIIKIQTAGGYAYKKITKESKVILQICEKMNKIPSIVKFAQTFITRHIRYKLLSNKWLCVTNKNYSSSHQNREAFCGLESLFV